MTALSESQDKLLRATSRSFYLTMRVLPRAIRPQIALAYLLARTADTIADTEVIPPPQRLEALQKLREQVLGINPGRLNFTEIAGKQGSPAEKLLVEKISDSLEALRQFSAEDQKAIRDVLGTITTGQELDLKRFTAASQDAPGKIIALETAAELDDYTYLVAGCVGEFWTKICRTHLFPDARLDERQFLMNGIRFGKGLQLVNILRDIPADLKKGRCYLPTEKLKQFGLSPESLLSTASERNFLRLFHEYLDKAQAHLRAGWDYTNVLPYSQLRVRLACAWPILIGFRTIEKLRVANVVSLQQHIKISREDMRDIMLQSVFTCPFPIIWKNLLLENQLH